MKSLLLFMFFIGIFLITDAIYQQKYDALKSNVRVEYRFIPKTYYEDQMAADDVTNNFATMFTRSSPWFNLNAGDPIVATKGEAAIKGEADTSKIAGVLAGNRMKT